MIIVIVDCVLCATQVNNCISCLWWENATMSEREREKLQETEE